MSKPSFPFYPDDWMNDLGLRSCSSSARGIWIDLMCLMHQGTPYGHLANAKGALPLSLLASRCDVTAKQIGAALTELEAHHVFSRTDQAVIFSRRMVRDEQKRVARGEGGKLNGKGTLKGTFESPPGNAAKGGFAAAPRSGGKGTFPPEEVEVKDSGFKKPSNTENTSAPPPAEIVPLSDFPRAERAILKRFQTTDPAVVRRVLDLTVQAYLSVDKPLIPLPDDDTIAEAVSVAHREVGVRQTSPMLFLRTVPAVVYGWAKHGKTAALAPELPSNSRQKQALDEIERRLLRDGKV